MLYYCVNLKRMDQDQLKQDCVELPARSSGEYVSVTETVLLFVKVRDFLQGTVKAFAEGAFAVGLVLNRLVNYDMTLAKL